MWYKGDTLTLLSRCTLGVAKSYGERLRGCNVRNMNPEKAESLSPELQRALEPLLAGIESLSERIREYNERIEAYGRDNDRRGAKYRGPSVVFRMCSIGSDSGVPNGGKE